MNPNETTISAQTAPPTPLPKGYLLSWKRWKSPLIENFILACILALLMNLVGGMHLSFVVLFSVGGSFILVTSMNSVGVGALRALGYGKFLRINLGCILAAIFGVIILHLIGIKQNFAFGVLIGIAMVFCLLQFPLAIYLNYKQKKSSTEATVADAN
ncbi:MAG: hypothetical protein ABR991_04625 [Terracidiphilus sp.]|jgi:hypothetical protein